MLETFRSLLEYCWKRMKTAFVDVPMRYRPLLRHTSNQMAPSVASGGLSYNSWFVPSVASTTTRLLHSSVSSAAGSTVSSSRASRAVNMLPTYLADARSVPRYSPETPEGALQLSVAENQMLEDMLLPGLTEMYSTQEFPSDAIYYQPTHGRPNTREAMASYLTDILKLSTPLEPEGIVVGAGCNAVLENLCVCLAEPGEGVMLPTPYYAAFQFDIGARAGLPIVPVTTMDYQTFDKSGEIPEYAYYPNRAALDAAYEKSIEEGVTPRILLISHPMNPLGVCYPPEVVKEMVDWCQERQIHYITDEIYAGSCYRSDANFVSALELASTNSSSDEAPLGLGPYVHFVYSLSKDFGLSGLRVGASYSENMEIRLPLQKLNDLCAISSQTQLLVERMLTVPDSEDPEKTWAQTFLDRNHERLRARGDALHQCLDELKIPYLKGTSGLFVWMDLSEFLPSEGDADERERALYLEMLQQYGLLLTPGRSMKNELPGFFRLVFTAASDHEFELGLSRLRTYVKAKKGTV
eukprot:Nitzschia sp. Nitz4//scaffold1_size375055//77396//79050//NITZ4_000230-RA/size375055-augustus-gene-0.662-mRNA-1//1//CDS//3329540907//5281//frame0